MKIVFATDHEYMPDFVGGREYSTHDLSIWLTRKGHEVTVLCEEFVPRTRLAKNLCIGPLRSIYASLRRTGSSWSVPYNVIRSRNVTSSIKRPEILENAEAIILQVHDPLQWLPALQEFKGVIAVYLRDSNYGYEIHQLNKIKNVIFISNSNFISNLYSKYISRNIPVIYPLIDIDRYKSEKTGNSVLFVNPVIPKGLEVAIQIAQFCPDIPFLFAEGWRQTRKKARKVRNRIDGISNIEWREQTTDMKEVYSKAKVLLVPSQCEEGFGRVIVEAQASGIPAIASDTGGLPEAVGDAGVLIPPYAPPTEWAAALRSMFDDDGLFDEYRRKAINAASRETLSSDILGGQFVSLLKSAANAIA